MARPKSTTPTAGELEILKVFWERGECTVRDVHAVLSSRRQVAHTTVASMIQLMHDKQLLELIDPRRPQRYKAAMDPQNTADGMVGELVKRVFGGSPRNLVMHLLGRKASPEQLQKVQKLLDELDE